MDGLLRLTWPRVLLRRFGLTANIVNMADDKVASLGITFSRVGRALGGGNTKRRRIIGKRRLIN